MLKTACCIVVFSTSVFGTVLDTFAAEPSKGWTRFRGENGVGVHEDCTVPLPWAKKDVKWVTGLPGAGNGSPVVFGNKIFVISADPRTAERYLVCIDLKTGEELWKNSYPSAPHHLHKRSSYASPTPCVNEDAVFVTWASPEKVELKALSHDGKTELWSKDLGPFVSQHGYGTSPALFGDTLILFNSQQAERVPQGMTPGQSMVLAFDAKTGDIKWKTPRTTTRACYGVPTYYRDLAGRELLLFANTGEGLFTLDLNTGEPVWNKNVIGKRSVSCPLAVGGVAIGTEGSGGGGNILWAVDLEGDHEVKFKVDRSAPYVPTPVAKDGLLFLWGDLGIVTCVELQSGKTVWKKRVGGNSSTSPVIAGDKLIGIAEDGTVAVLAASRDYKEFGTIKLEETTRATPLVAENYILVRTDSRLMCVGNPAAN